MQRPPEFGSICPHFALWAIDVFATAECRPCTATAMVRQTGGPRVGSQIPLTKYAGRANPFPSRPVVSKIDPRCDSTPELTSHDARSYEVQVLPNHLKGTSFTCAPCRRKKRRCDGATPVCGRCARSINANLCTYTPASDLVQYQSTLRKGLACVPCRQRKKRCDAGRPHCSTCKAIGKLDQCVYTDQPRKSPSGKAQTDTTQPSDNSPPPTPEIPNFVPAESEPLFGDAVFLADPLAPTSSAVQMTEPDITRIPLVDVFFSSNSFQNHSSQTSDRNLDGLTLAIRALFMAYNSRMGYVLTPAKSDAIVEGDFTNPSVHPYFIHLSNMLGCYLYQETHLDFRLLYLNSLLVTACRESVTTLTEDVDPLACTQANLLAAQTFIYTNRVSHGLQYFHSVRDIVNRRHLRLVPPQTPGGNNSGLFQLTQDARERISLLSQVLYVDVYLSLMHEESGNQFSRLETEFRFHLPLAYPDMQRDPVVMRTGSMLLIRDAIRQMDTIGSSGTVTVAWHTATVKILVDLTYLVDQMLPLMEQFEQVQDHDRSLCLRYTSIISLTTIAEIHNMLSNTTPDSRIKRLESLQTLAQLTEEIPWNLRHLMDQYICICWDRSIALVNSLPAPELGDLSRDVFVAVMSHAKTEYGNCPPSASAEPNSLCVNLRAVDERLRMACEAQYLIPASASSIDEDISQMVNF
ncbi:hypothetical protein BDM02DRAFT_1153843 [Thelephora ganbajun]|uniref:Uncharacterized protein n=1 Tax=Thelephora ganbajun TaxID=370292 RepID=A0ACB6ZW25_THEGA|nr:hypothetical protein BDM02DRAFT_1153843 [Thelephora ganbajun]